MTCANPGTEFASSFGISLANMFGFGGLIEQHVPTPLDKLQKQIQDQQSSNQELLNRFTISATQALVSSEENNLDLISATNQTLNAEMALHDEILREKITSNTIYIAVIFIILMIIYIYIIIAT